MIRVKYEGIDRFNRPVFKSTTSNERYGSIDILFYKFATLDEIHADVKEKDLVYFGKSKDCEPIGTKPKGQLKIVR